MSHLDEQKEDFATVKERSLKLKLSDVDAIQLYKMATSEGLTVEELLENFICDLVDSNFRNGSDEHDCAEDWFSCCGFSHLSEPTFLRYLIQDDFDLIGDAIEYWNYIKEYEAELLELEEASDRDSIKSDYNKDDEIKGLQEELEYQRDNLNKIFSDFKSKKYNEGINFSLDEEMQKIIEWKNKLDRFLNNSNYNTEVI